MFLKENLRYCLFLQRESEFWNLSNNILKGILLVFFIMEDLIQTYASFTFHLS